MAWETLVFETDAGVGVITLNRLHRLNAINMILQKELIDLLDKCESDEGVRALVVTGGPKYFSVGADNETVARSSLLYAWHNAGKHRAWRRLMLTEERGRQPRVHNARGRSPGG